MLRSPLPAALAAACGRRRVRVGAPNSVIGQVRSLGQLASAISGQYQAPGCQGWQSINAPRNTNQTCWRSLACCLKHCGHRRFVSMASSRPLEPKGSQWRSADAAEALLLAVQRLGWQFDIAAVTACLRTAAACCAVCRSALCDHRGIAHSLATVAGQLHHRRACFNPAARCAIP